MHRQLKMDLLSFYKKSYATRKIISKCRLQNQCPVPCSCSVDPASAWGQHYLHAQWQADSAGKWELFPNCYWYRNLRKQPRFKMLFWLNTTHKSIIKQHIKELFTQLPTYFRLLQLRDPNVYTHFSLDENTGWFQGLFICPSASQYSFSHCRPFVAFDGTFWETRFIQTLLRAVTMDVNNQLSPLAYTVFESKNTSS